MVALGMGEKVAAATISDTMEKNYVFVSTSGEACSATVHVSLNQDYSNAGTMNVYGNRKGCVWMTYVATFSIPHLSATDPVYVNANDAQVKSFSPWSNYSVLLPGGSYCAYAKQNSTSVSYYNTISYYMKQGYMVGNSDYMVTPWFGDNLKIKL